jgi:hypothetical protein
MRITVDGKAKYRGVAGLLPAQRESAPRITFAPPAEDSRVEHPILEHPMTSI